MAHAGPSRPLSGLAALFLTHFDDIQGQVVLYYESTGLPQEGIEHASLPSGLHLLDSDVVCFRHHHKPGVGVFRSRQVESGRGRQMGTLGVVLANESVEDLFSLQRPLEDLFNELEAVGSPLQKLSEGDDEPVRTKLAAVWKEARSPRPSTSGPSGPSSPSSSSSGVYEDRQKEMDGVRRLVDGRTTAGASHPITYLPALLSILGPQLIPIYKAALTHKRILIYSPPPLLPLAAFAWCIWAMSIPPSSLSTSSTSPTSSSLAPESEASGQSSKAGMSWLGNVGLMDLTDLKARKGGWVATTSDAIFRSHQTYDLFLDLSASPPALHGPPLPNMSSSSSHGPSISYTLSDLPLYRSLLLLDTSPPSITILPTADGLGEEGDEEGDDHAHVHHHSHGKEIHKGGYSTWKSESRSIYTRQGGWWLLAFDMFNRAWALCVGVCDYATGRGRVGEISLGEGEEDAALLGDRLPRRARGGIRGPVEADDEDDDQDSEEGERDMLPEDEAIRRGRLILRQLHHHTYHLLGRLRQVAGPRDALVRDKLSDKEVKELVGGKIWGGAGEVKFWQELAATWGFLKS